MDRETIKTFEELLTSVDRQGMDKLLNYIQKSDFYTAPASTRYHLCCEGGLLKHSLNVYGALSAKTSQAVWSDILAEVGNDSIIISSLLHDICKTNFYATEMRNKKVYKETGSKSDSGGRFDWESVATYVVNDKVPYGHGEKSVMMIEEFIKLKPVERYAIRWHMGFTEPKEQYNTLSAAINKYPFILALHEADLEATYLLEKEA